MRKRKRCGRKYFPTGRNKTIDSHWLRQVPQEVKDIAVKTGIIDVEIKTQSAPGEIAPGFEMIINRGFKDIVGEAEEKIAALDAVHPEDFEKINFYRAVMLCAEGMIDFANRYAALAENRAEGEVDPDRKAELKHIAEICRRVPAYPAGTFREAMQSLWFVLAGCHMEGNGPSYSPGRVDQYLYPFYRDDLKNGRLTEEQALELIECLYVKFPENTWFLSKNAAMYFAGYQPYQNITVGGVKADGSDATNALSYLFLKAKMDVRLHSPSLAVRVHQQSPERFLLEVAKLAKLGTGFPAIHSDDVTIKMMLLTGATIEDARNYQLVGCVEPYIPGKMSKWTDGGHYNFASAVEFALTAAAEASSMTSSSVPGPAIPGRCLLMS